MMPKSHRWVGSSAVLALAILGCGEEDAGPIQFETWISVTISTTGGAPDGNGYMLALGDGMPIRVSTNGTYDFEVDPGTYTLQLTDVQLNCSVPVNPRMVTAREGTTVRATMQVDCQVPLGQIEVSVVTSGAVPDSDGYSVTVPVGVLGTIQRNLGPNDTANLGSFFSGNYTVTLSGIAANCSTVPTTRAATVVPGSLARVSFAVVCQDPTATGVLRLLIATSGPTLDPDGDAVTIDSGVPVQVGVNDSLIVNLSGGTHLLRLSGLSTGCSVAGGNPRYVSVVNGLTTTAAFSVVCRAEGQIRFHGTTSGTQIPGLFIGIVSFGAQLVDIVDLNPNGVVVSGRHPAGTYTVTILTGICTGGLRTTANVPAGGYAEVFFTAACP